MFRTLSVLGVFLTVSCSNFGQLKFVAQLPDQLNEVSGLVQLKDSTVWAVADSGNPDNIYQVDYRGNLLKTFKVKNAKNKDWEDLTKDDRNNIYIADTGNNANDRKDLVIYKIPNPEIEKGDKIDAVKIEFSFPEQKEFPPKKWDLYYDTEAIFYAKNKLYLVTRNRAHPFDGNALLYTVPNTQGKHMAKRIGKINFCKDLETCQITSIAISPNREKIVALGKGKLFVFTDFTLDDFSKGALTTIDLGTRTQLESVCFVTDKLLLLADEKSNGTGGNLYSYTLKD